MGIYVQYGCGLSAPEGWVNFDSSPTLRLQKIPLIGSFFKKKVPFPSSVKYGDILKGLPGIKNDSCQGVYCSHVLEHLSLDDCRRAIKNTYDMLQPGGYFRCVLPSLEAAVANYTEVLKTKQASASIEFMNETLLGLQERPHGLKGMAVAFWGNSHHLWMWDQFSLAKELKDAGFTSVRPCSFNDSSDTHFNLVEDRSRFYSAVALEAIK